MSAMTMATTNALALHHDLLIELGRIDMALDSLEAQRDDDGGEQVDLRERLSAHRVRIHEALKRLEA